MRKIIVILLSSILATLVGLIALVFILNAFDEPLSPEVQKILQREQKFSERQKLAYFFVLGLYAGETEHPEQKGAELWPQHDRPGFWDKLKKPFDVQFGGCGRDVCSSAYIEHDMKILENLEKYREQISNYSRLMEYEEGCDLFVGDRKTPIVSVMGLPIFSIHRLFLLQMAQMVREGQTGRVLDLITASNHYLQSFYADGTFLEHMMAVVDMKMNAQFIQAELASHPQWRLPRKLVDSIVVPDALAVLTDALERDLRTFDNISHGEFTLADFELSNLGPAGDEKFSRGIKSRLPARWFLRPNETVNKYYELSLGALNAECPSGANIEECLPSLEWSSLSNPWHWLENPLGRVLSKLCTVNFAGRRKSLEKHLREIREIKMGLLGRV